MIRKTRSTNTTESSEDDKRGKHAKTGFAWFLEIAPPNTPFAEVAEAYKEYDSPHQAWPSGPNHTLTDFAGETA